MIGLKPCPFCGGKPFKRMTEHDGFIICHVTCRDCGADVRSTGHYPHYCETLWNRRAYEKQAD